MFADDNTLFACDISLENVIIRLNKDALAVNNWFGINSMVANPEKFSSHVSWNNRSYDCLYKFRR